METIKEEKKAELEKEIETLKDNIEFLHSCLDDRDKSIAILQEENKTLKDNVAWYEKEEDRLREENKKLKDRIDVLYEFIERNDKLVDEVINEEDLDKLNRYIYIDDDLVDRTLESED